MSKARAIILPSLRSAAAVFLLALACPATYAAEAERARPLDLCPPAKRSQTTTYHLRDVGPVTVAAPKTPEEAARHRRETRSADDTTRTLAIAALAMAGDLPLLRQLVQTRDQFGLPIYALFYRNPQGTRCIAEAVEAMILEHVDDAQIAVPLVRMLSSRNLYRSRELFDALRAITPDTHGYDDFINAGAIAATRRADISAGLLEHVSRRVDYYETDGGGLPRRTNWLRPYLQHFDEMGYEPGIAWFHELYARVSALPDGRRRFSDLRPRMRLLSERHPSPAATRFLREEFHALSGIDWDELDRSRRDDYALELEYMLLALTEKSPSALPPDEIVAGIDGILRKVRRYDEAHRIRYACYRALAAIGTPEAADLLVREYVTRRPLDEDTGSDERKILLGMLQESFLGQPVDVAALIEHYTFRNDLYHGDVLSLIAEHPRPPEMARDYLLWLIEQQAEWQDMATTHYLKEAVKGLSSYHAAEVYADTRQALQGLYEAGRLTQNELHLFRHVPFSDMERTVIEEQAPALDGVRRAFSYLFLPIEESAGPLRLDGPELAGYHRLADGDGYYLLRLVTENVYRYLMVNQRTGSTSELVSAPQVSPDGRWLVSSEIDLEIGDRGNVIVIHRAEDGALLQVWGRGYAFEEHTGPANPRWVDDETLEYEEWALDLETWQVEKHPVRVSLTNGSWKAEESSQ